LLKVARRRSRCLQDAEDAVHEAMARAAERPHLDGDRIGAWLTLVTVRLCIDQNRQLSRDAGLCRRAGSMLTAPGTVPHEEAVCDRAEARWLVLQGLELPKNQMDALWLKAQDLDVAHVAQRMGLTYRAAESLLGRARRTLRAALAATLALAVGVWRRVDVATPVAPPAARLASAGAVLVIAGLVLTPETGGVHAPPPHRDQYAEGSPVPSRDEPNRPVPNGPATVSDPAEPGAPVVPGAASRPMSDPPAEAVPSQTDGSVPEQQAPLGVLTTDLLTLPPVLPLPIPAEPPAIVQPDDVVPVLSDLPGTLAPADVLPLPQF
jgi:RNA polymerase sigma factor (sigma-70 family)